MRILSLALLFFVSCSDDRLPEGVLQPEKTQAVLYDIIRADEWVDFASLQDSTFRAFSKRGALYDSVFQIHGITKDAYRRTMQFYQSRPDLLKEVIAGMKAQSDSALVRKAPADTSKKLQLK